MAEPVPRQPTASTLVPALAQVRDRRAETRGVWTLDLELPGFGPVAPGQFNMLYAMGVGEIPISVSGGSDGDSLVHTIRGVGAVSGALAGLEPGDVVGVRGPFGSSWPLHEAAGKDVIVMGGGLGLAPLRPLVRQLLAAPREYGSISLLYGARSPDDILYGEELERWREAAAHVEITVDHTTSGWPGPVGVVTELLHPELFDPANVCAYVCGPEVMMRFSARSLMEMGVPASAIHVSMERNMKCAVGHCGHCQFGTHFVCKDGPVFRFEAVRDILGIREL
jgi:NAD(P)H-flavin reductase